jgi:hypothetical protein
MIRARLPYIVIAFMVLTLTAYDVWKLAAFWSATHHVSLAAPRAENSRTGVAFGAGAREASLPSIRR